MLLALRAQRLCMHQLVKRGALIKWPHLGKHLAPAQEMLPGQDRKHNSEACKDFEYGFVGRFHLGDAVRNALASLAVSKTEACSPLSPNTRHVSLGRAPNHASTLLVQAQHLRAPYESLPSLSK